jgi:hypothetical protein
MVIDNRRITPVFDEKRRLKYKIEEE